MANFGSVRYRDILGVDDNNINVRRRELANSGKGIEIGVEDGVDVFAAGLDAWVFGVVAWVFGVVAWVIGVVAWVFGVVAWVFGVVACAVGNWADGVAVFVGVLAVVGGKLVDVVTLLLVGNFAEVGVLPVAEVGLVAVVTWADDDDDAVV
ncbi:uncharacterized protein TRIADDRAFT_61295 [Trichoplax adhaerens]|uniref:Uncharacterized protein n=1 Tax=Trichoplax adhaerens TaxID=10228 RepID=B3SAK8_TRIAD|nr:predicted protein [Trichoplax adhaerens]EDV20277.1 predicted protein [Trichoplax adhaerens]|eukprot:XP_002117227.1 predicted protein [Trichoplax adhaerens]